MPSDKDIVETDRLLRAADKQASVIHDLVYAKPFDVKATSDAVWVLHGILRAKQLTNPPWCHVCSAPHNFGEGDQCAAILKKPGLTTMTTEANTVLSESEVEAIEHKPWVMLTPDEKDALCQTVKALRAENERLNQCPWCGAEMERVPVDGGDELGCTREACPSFGIGVWCYADHLRLRLSKVESEQNSQ